MLSLLSKMSETRKIILLTSHFPYYKGEQFLEEEIKYWHSDFPGNLTILPANAEDSQRTLPTNIKIDTSLTQKNNFLYGLVIRFKAFFSLLFLKEIFYLIREHNFLHPKCFLFAFRTCFTTLEQYHKLKQYIKRNKIFDLIVYSYWFDTTAYAAALLKRKKLIGHLVTRAHGFDVYQSRRPYSYMPLKRQFNDDFDLIFAISQEGKNYLQNAYGISNRRVIVSRLGVEIPKKTGSPTCDENTLVIVSVSNCIEIKRIDKIIKGIELLTTRNKSLHVTWHHIGTGYQLNQLKAMSEKAFRNSHVNWNFHGEFSNEEVKNFLYKNKIDVFINTSDSEGVPVSIMEAMSYGIPAIAPAVGGIPELVDHKSGVLVKPNPDVNSIFKALNHIAHLKDIKTREMARLKIENDFNSTSNYKKFIEFLQQLES